MLRAITDLVGRASTVPLASIQGEVQALRNPFDVGCALLLLLQERLLSPQERMVAWYALSLCAQPDAENQRDSTELDTEAPFSDVLLQCLSSDSTSVSSTEKRFLHHVLQGLSRDQVECTPEQVLRQIEEEEARGDAFPLTAEEIESRRKASRRAIPASLPMVLQSGFLPVLPHGKWETNTPSSVFGPQFGRLCPPLLEATQDELLWLNLEHQHSLLWDPSRANRSGGSSSVESLVERALGGPLTLAQQQIVINALHADPKLVDQCALTPLRFPVLVENNPAIAIEFLLQLVTSERIPEYLYQLVHMELSLHSMEVVNRLATVVELPSEFVHLYVSNCIQSCENMKDKYMQNRLVRLVCVFLQSLIRNKIVNVKDLFIEVQAFCIDFSRIREAAALFRLLKSFE